jgi:hypothetical protein
LIAHGFFEEAETGQPQPAAEKAWRPVLMSAGFD